MSQENVELVRSAFAGWERGDYSPADWHHSDVEFVMADGPNPGRWTGSDGVGEGWGDFLSAWRDFRQVADAYRELDAERVLVLFHFSGHGKTSGLEVEQMGSEAAGLFHIRDGKVSRVDLYFDRSAALEAAGLAE
jgi:ketosteroid isomerase-like protein